MDILNLAVYLAWPEDANVKHQFARAIAQRLLDPRPHPPTARPKDGAYGRFTEGMPSLGSFLSSKHGALRQQVGASKLKDFILNPGTGQPDGPCTAPTACHALHGRPALKFSFEARSSFVVPTAECTNMIIHHGDALGKAGAIELDVRPHPQPHVVESLTSPTFVRPGR